MSDTFFDRIHKNDIHTPDVLSCLANLSNDEVFTSPDIVNQMLDMLPQELFVDPNAKFLDPACKTGVFLREIAKRLIVGLEPIYPDLQERIDHIFHEQLYGIAITELTSLLSRRSLYCSKYPNSRYSISKFDDAEGNIRFKKIKHTWVGEQCEYCGASKKEFDRSPNLETHAYEFIHNLNVKEVYNMKFDVIISNPPYQLTDSSLSASATPIYHKFINQAIKLQPRYLVMIVPSRWMAGGKGLDNFRESMINDKHITQLHDFINSNDCFTGVDIPGGVCYFLRERDREDKCIITTHNSDCTKTSKRYLKEEGVDVMIRHSELIEIKEKVWKDKNQISFSNIVSSQKPYGIRTDFFTPTIQKEINGVKKKIHVSTEEKYGLPTPSNTPIKDGYEILGLVGNKRTWKFVSKDYKFPKNNGIGKWKIFIPNAYGCGAVGEVANTPVLGTPVLGLPNQVCTETFLELGPWNNEIEATNALKYLKTKFFRVLISIIKQTQHTSSQTYKYVPMQNFTNSSDINWSTNIPNIDEQLFNKYNLSEEDICFINNNIREME